MKSRKRTTKSLNSLILYTAFLFGVSLTIISPVLIEISSTISASVESMGVLFSIFFLGFIIGAFLNSLLSKYMLRKKIFLFSTFFLSASFIAVVFAPTLLYLLISFFIMGICGGLIETTVSLVIIDVNEKRKGFYINILHAFIGLGAFMGPYLHVLSINMGFSWRSSFLVLSVLCLISFLFYFFFKIPEPIISEKSSIFGSFKKVRFDLKFFMILILFFVMFFYVNVELGINTWIPTYLRIEKGFTFLSASNTLSNFWLFFTIGRFLFGFLSKKISIGVMILSLSILSIVPVVMSIYIENKILIVMFVSLSGLFLSSLYPLIINLSIFSYKRYKNFIIPLLIMIGGTGGIFSPWLIGFVFGKYSMFLGMNLIIIFQFLLFVSISIFLLSNGKSRKLFFKKS